MNKQELQKKYQEIVLKINGGNDDYVVALCQIANAINELDEPKQDTKWQKLKEWLEEQQNNFKLISKTLGKTDYVLLSNCIKSVLSEMAKLEGEDE